jgi:hypothetical protein
MCMCLSRAILTASVLSDSRMKFKNGRIGLSKTQARYIGMAL